MIDPTLLFLYHCHKTKPDGQVDFKAYNIAKKQFDRLEAERQKFLDRRLEGVAKLMIGGKVPENRRILAFELSRMTIAKYDHSPRPKSKRSRAVHEGTWNAYSESEIYYQ